VLAHDSDIFSRYYEFHRILEPRPHDAQHPDRIPYLVTANCAIRRTAFMRAGGFDERLPLAGGEDAALSIRMVKRGYFLERVPDAVVRHRFRRGLRDFARGPSTAMAWGAAMSWIDIFLCDGRPASVYGADAEEALTRMLRVRDLPFVWIGYRRAGLRTSEQVGFLLLDVVRTIAYRCGFRDGATFPWPDNG
jgi:GT2 family glycosyltransferase